MNEDEDKDLESRDGVEGEERSEQEIEGVEGARADSSDDDSGERDADDTGESKSGKESVGFKKRVSKLTAQRREAEKQRDAALAKLRSYEEKERQEAERQRRADEATPEGQKRLARREQIRAINDEAYGEGYSDWVERERMERHAERERQKEEYALRGISYLKSELEDHGIAVDDKSIIRWERAVGSELAEDPVLAAAFGRPATQQKAIEEATKRVIEGLANPAIKQQGGQPLKRIERNRNAVFSGNANAQSEQQPFPDDYVAKPPKNATPEQQAQFWVEHRDKIWKQLGERA